VEMAWVKFGRGWEVGFPPLVCFCAPQRQLFGFLDRYTNGSGNQPLIMNTQAGILDEISRWR
jgi:hypothetical protein